MVEKPDELQKIEIIFPETVTNQEIPALPYRTNLIDADEMRFNCENCGYAIFRVDKIRSQTIVDMDCPKCGHRNRATFTPPQQSYGKKEETNGKSIPYLGRLQPDRKGARPALRGQDPARSPRGIDDVGLSEMREDAAQILPGGEVQPQRLPVPERGDADGTALSRIGRRLRDYLARTCRSIFFGARKHQAEDPLAGDDRRDRRSVVPPTRLYAHKPCDGDQTGDARPRTGRHCWYPACRNQVTHKCSVTRTADGSVQVLAELFMCSHHHMGPETLGQLPIMRAIKNDGLMLLTVEEIPGDEKENPDRPARSGQESDPHSEDVDADGG